MLECDMDGKAQKLIETPLTPEQERRAQEGYQWFGPPRGSMTLEQCRQAVLAFDYQKDAFIRQYGVSPYQMLAEAAEHNPDMTAEEFDKLAETLIPSSIVDH